MGWSIQKSYNIPPHVVGHDIHLDLSDDISICKLGLQLAALAKALLGKDIQNGRYYEPFEDACAFLQ